MPFGSAISGMRAAQIHLETIGNNVANANTTGFKQSRTEFADIYAGSKGGGGTASNNPGNGVNVSRVAQQFTQGTISSTSGVLDMAIDGEGFFIVEDDGTRLYTRAGAFGLDDEGNIVNAQKQSLIGYQADDAGNISGALGPIQLSTSETNPIATTQVDLTLNLDANKTLPTVGTFDPDDPDSYSDSTSTTLYDSLGNSHLATMYFVKDATANTWDMEVYVDGASAGSQTLTFDTGGNLTAPASGVVTGLTATPTGADPLSFDLDISRATQYGAGFSVSEVTQNGFTTGRLSGIDIDSLGVIYARYTNGVSEPQGQIALANFQNTQGLQKLGNNSWGETNDSGTGVPGRPGTSDLGLLQAGALEDSNVDLTAQLVDMIIAQRNFQANAQVISTADAVTQAVINIR